MKFKNDTLVLLCAFRYSLGRKTYMTEAIADELKANWKELSKRDQNQIKSDIEMAIESDNAGMAMDVRLWKEILKL